MNDSTIQKHDHILFFSMGQHSYHVYFEAISKIRPTHVFFITNKEIIDAGKSGWNKYKLLRNTDSSLKSNPDLKSLFEFQKKYTNPYNDSKGITPLEIDGMIVTTLLNEIKETQNIINKLHTEGENSFVRIINDNKNKDRLRYLSVNPFLETELNCCSNLDEEWKIYKFGKALFDTIPPVVIAEINDKDYLNKSSSVRNYHIIVDDAKPDSEAQSWTHKNTVQEAIADALVEYSKKIRIISDNGDRVVRNKWINPKYSFHISAGRNQFILSLYTMAMWLGADVYLSPRESGLQKQQLPGMDPVLHRFNEKELAIFRYFNYHSTSDIVDGADIYCSARYLYAHVLNRLNHMPKKDTTSWEKAWNSIYKICQQKIQDLDNKKIFDFKRLEEKKYTKQLKENMKIINYDILTINESENKTTNDTQSKELLLISNELLLNESKIKKGFTDQKDRLEENGYIELEKDGRQNKLKLTEKGKYACLLLKIFDMYE